MTKRFTFIHNEVGINIKTPILDDNTQLNIGEVLDKLNELNDENRELKQLKEDNNIFFTKVFDILLKYQDLFNREMADEVLDELGIELTKWFE